MKKILILVAAIFMAASSLHAQSKGGKIDTTKHNAYYACPMHPDVMSSQAGKCPKCGMELSLSTKEQMKANVTRNYRCPMHVDVSSHDPGKCPKCGRKLNLASKEQMKAATVKLYTCPMHPNVSLDKDGVCPKCGKQIVEKKNK